MKSYLKVKVKCKDIEPVEGMEIVIRPPVPKPIEKKYFDPAEYSKKYREKNKAKLDLDRKDNYEKNKHEILRKKQLWYLNIAQTVKKPRQDTIDKYGLKYDDDLEKWV